MFSRLGSFAYRRRRWVLAGSSLFVLVAALMGTGVFGRLGAGGFDDPSAESTRAKDVLAVALRHRRAQPRAARGREGQGLAERAGRRLARRSRRAATHAGRRARRHDPTSRTSRATGRSDRSRRCARPTDARR